MKDPEPAAEETGSYGISKRGEKAKVHSLIDKFYHPTNLRLAWNKVRENRGVGGVDQISIDAFQVNAEEALSRLHEELKASNYKPLPVRRAYIPKRGKPQETRPLGIPAIRDRVCQQALNNRLEPIFEPAFNDCSYGYRPGRLPHDALRKIWKELMQGYCWIVDADLRDYFGSVPHEKLIDLVAKKVSDGRVLRLIRQMLKAGYVESGQQLSTPKGTPQGGVISPLLSNIYLTLFDDELTKKGYRLTRYCDDWVILCRTRKEAEEALQVAKEILASMELTIHPEKTRISHVAAGFEFLGYKIRRGRGTKLPSHKIKKKFNSMNIYAYPTQKSIERFMDQIRSKTKRNLPLTLQEIVNEINPVIRGWGNYYCKAHVRKLFSSLRNWIIRRIWAHQKKCWRNMGWKEYPEIMLYDRYGLVNLIRLIPDIGQRS